MFKVLCVVVFVMLMVGCGQREVSNVGSYIDEYGLMPLPDQIDIERRGDENDGDKHDAINASPFVSVAHQPLSTFSIDVDTASYSKLRQHLRDYRRLPRPDAVRIEELVNYFDYQYAAPADEIDSPLAMHCQTTDCPWNTQHQLVRVALKGRDLDWGKRSPVNLVLLIDTSGSMEAANKLPLLQRSVRMLLSRLGTRDRIAIVAYAGHAGVVLNSTSASEHELIYQAVESLRPHGSTNGGDGLQVAYQIARDHFKDDGVNRILLCTDGDFNVGQTSNDQLIRLVADESRSGIDLTVLGFGMGNLNDVMLEQISNRGNGNYAFIDSPSEARKVLVGQITGTLVTIAKDVKIQIEFNPKAVTGYRLLGYENRMLENEDFNDDKIDAGELGAGHTVTAFYEVIPSGVKTKLLRDVDPLKYSATKVAVDDPTGGELMTVKLRFKLPGETESRSIEHVVVNETVRFDLADQDFRFAAAVAGFGMKLREIEQGNPWGLTEIRRTAASATGQDVSGLRTEFLSLVDAVMSLRDG